MTIDLKTVKHISKLARISIDDEKQEKEEEGSSAVSELLIKVQEFYSNNELARYATWAFFLILLSTSALTVLEYDMFNASVKEHAEGSFTFGEKDPNWVDTFFHTFWWSIVTFTTVGYGDVSPVTHLGKFLTIIIMLLNFGVVTLLGGAVAAVLVAQRLTGDDTLDENKFELLKLVKIKFPNAKLELFNCDFSILASDKFTPDNSDLAKPTPDKSRFSTKLQLVQSTSLAG